MWVLEKEVCESINNSNENTRFLAGVKLSKTITATNDFEDSLKDSELVLIVVPTPFLRTAVCDKNKFLPVNVPLVLCAKGIENSSLLTPYEILADELPGKYHDNIAVLSGPSFAKEVASSRVTSVLVAAEHRLLAERVQYAMSDENFRIYTGTDVIGAELGGALKNVIAIACGFATGLDLGKNTMAMILTRGLAEISTLAIHKGAHPSTMNGLAGMGDLILTATSTQSRNFTVGTNLAKGMKMKEITGNMNNVAEGVKTAKSVKIMCDQYGLDLPLCNAVYEVLWEDKDLGDAFRKMATLPLEEEFNPYELYKQVQRKSKL